MNCLRKKSGILCNLNDIFFPMATFLTKAFRTVMLPAKLQSASSTQVEKSLNNDVARKVAGVFMSLTKESNSHLRNYARESG